MACSQGSCGSLILIMYNVSKAGTCELDEDCSLVVYIPGGVGKE